MTGLSVPVVTDINLEAVQTSVHEAFHNTRGSFLAFLQLAFRDQISNVPCYAKAKDTEVKCLNFLDLITFARVLKDMCPNGNQSPEFPFEMRSAGPGSDWLKYNAKENAVGMCMTHTTMGQARHLHCALQDCRSYCWALWQFTQGHTDPTAAQRDERQLSVSRTVQQQQQPQPFARQCVSNRDEPNVGIQGFATVSRGQHFATTAHHVRPRAVAIRGQRPQQQQQQQQKQQQQHQRYPKRGEPNVAWHPRFCIRAP
jgi:hypothetical protein